MTTPSKTVNPWAGKAVGGNWAWHLKNNGGRGGTDYKVAAGVAVQSPCAGEAVHLNDGLNTIVITRNDGKTFHMEENRSIVGSFPRAIGLLEEVAITGLNRSNIVRWPHIHEQDSGSMVRHAFDEPAVNAPYLATGIAPIVVSNITPDQVKRVATYLNGRKLGKSSTASTTGIAILPGSASSNYYWMVQQAGKIDGIYGTGYLVDSIPGPKTYEVEKHYAALTDPAPINPPVTPAPEPVPTSDPIPGGPPIEPIPEPASVDPTPTPDPAPVEPTSPPTQPTPTSVDPVTPKPPTTPTIPVEPSTPAAPKNDLMASILKVIKLFLSIFAAPKK